MVVQAKRERMVVMVDRVLLDEAQVRRVVFLLVKGSHLEVFLLVKVRQSVVFLLVKVSQLAVVLLVI